MKKKVLIFAIMLLFSSMAFAADVTDVDFTLSSTGVGVVGWSTTAPANEVDDWSVKLDNIVSGDGYSAVAFAPSGTVTLSDFEADIHASVVYNFLYNFDGNSSNGPHLELMFEDPNDDGWVQVTVVGLQGYSGTPDDWETYTLVDATPVLWWGKAENGTTTIERHVADKDIVGIVSDINASGTNVACGDWVLTRVKAENYEDENICYIDDITINGDTYKVDDPVYNATKETYYNSIKAAIAGVSADDIIQVPPGTYVDALESFPIQIDVAGVTLQSTGTAAETIIDAAGNGVAIRIGGTPSTPVTTVGVTIDGFTVTASAGCPIYLAGADDAIIQNNVVNTVTSSGVGIDVSWYATGVTVSGNTLDEFGSLLVHGSNCTVSGNTVGRDIVVFPQQAQTIDSTVITDNTLPVLPSETVNGGIQLWGGEASGSAITNTLIEGNTIALRHAAGLRIGSSYGTNLTIANLTVTGNNITNSAVDGIYIHAGVTWSTGNTINYNDFSGNTDYGINNLGAEVVDAKYNWWGDVSGPQHADTNPNGTGNDVKDNVTYVPWLDDEFSVGGATGGIPVELTIISDLTVQVGVVVTIGDTLKDVNGNLIDDETISYSLVGVGTILSSSEVTSDDGYTSIDFLAGYLPGTAAVRAEFSSDTTVNATVTITVGVGPVAEVVVTPVSDTLVVLGNVTIVAELLDAYENHIDADTSMIDFTVVAQNADDIISIGAKSVTDSKKIQIVYTTDSLKTGLSSYDRVTATYVDTDTLDFADIYTYGDEVAPDSLTVTFTDVVINVSDDSTSTTTFNVVAKDQHGNLTEDRRITFSASYGTLESVDTTNASGVFANALAYYGGTEAQVVILTATATEGGATGKDTLYLEAEATDSILITCLKTSVVAGEEVTLTFTYLDSFENETEELSPVFSNNSALAALGTTVEDTIETDTDVLHRASVYGVLLTKTYTVSDTITATYVDTIVATVGSVVDTFFMNLASSGVLYSFDIVIDHDSVVVTDDMTFTITAKDPGGNRKYDYEGDVLIELIGSSADSVNWTGDVDTCLSDILEFVAEDAFVDGVLELTLKNRWAEYGLTFSVTDTATDIFADTTGFDFRPGIVDSLELKIIPSDIYAGDEFDYSVAPVDTFGNVNSTERVSFYMTAKDPGAIDIAANKWFITGLDTLTVQAKSEYSGQYLEYFDAKRYVADDFLADKSGKSPVFDILAADVTDPVITLTSPTADTILALADLPLDVAGTASDMSSFTLTVNGVTVVVAADSSFATTLAFADFEGDTTVVVKAVDSQSNETTITVDVTIDTTGPVLANMAPVDSTRLREPVTDVCFSATDALSGVDTTTAVLTFDGIVVETEITEPVDGGYKFTYTTDSLANGWYTYSVEVKDMAGNVIKDSAVFEIDLNMLGDVDFDDAITTIDANMVLEYAVGLHASWDGTDTVEVADVTGDNVVGAYDAAQIFKYALGIDTTFSPLAKKVLAYADMIFDKAIATGEAVISVPLRIENARNVYSVELTAEIDPAIVEISAVEFSLPEGWIVARNIEDGKVHLAMAGITPLKSSTVANLKMNILNKEASAKLTGNVVVNNNRIKSMESLSIKAIPAEFKLSHNYPNPFNPTTTMSYQLPEDSKVVITIYDILGHRVRTLVNKNMEAGYYSVIWNGLNENGKALSSGTYFYQIRAGKNIATRKMLLMK